MIESLEEERHLFHFLKNILWTEPTTDMLSGLLDIKPVDEQNELDHGFNSLIRCVQANRDRLDTWCEELSVEFAGLFIGPRQAPVVPFASFYLSDTKTVMTEVTVDVRKHYLASGMAVKNLYSMPDDHIAAELEFLAYLSDQCLEAFAQGDQEEASKFLEQKESFFREHFSLWVPQFADALIKAAESDFYRGAGVMLKELAKG